MVVSNRSLSFKLPAYNMATKLNRTYSLGSSYDSSFLPEYLLKVGVDGSSVGFLLYSDLNDKISIRVDSEFVGSEYILFLNLFNAFFETRSKDSFFVFKAGEFSPHNTATRLLGSLKLELNKEAHFLNFMYFVLFFYLPRLGSLGSTTQAFASSVVFPDFSRYVNHFSTFTRKYPHYSGVLRKSGLLVFLDDFNISFNLAVSSYVLKSTYVSMSQSEDWSLKFKVYFGSKVSISYFKLKKSFLKFFVVGAEFLA